VAQYPAYPRSPRQAEPRAERPEPLAPTPELRAQSPEPRAGTKNRLTALTLDMFKHKNQFSILKHTKAAVARTLLLVVEQLCEAGAQSSEPRALSPELRPHSPEPRARQEFFDDSCEMHHHRIICVIKMQTIMSLILASPAVPTDEAAATALALYEDFCKHYNWLTKDSLGRGELCYNQVPVVFLSCFLKQKTAT